MSYSKDLGEVSARYRPTGEVAPVTYPSGTHVVFTAPGSATNGQYGLFEWNMTGSRGGADPHFHKTFSESFYVMDGAVRLFNGETWIDAVKGDFLYVPEGGIHAFSNESGAPARMGPHLDPLLFGQLATGRTDARPDPRLRAQRASRYQIPFRGMSDRHTIARSRALPKDSHNDLAVSAWISWWRTSGPDRAGALGRYTRCLR